MSSTHPETSLDLPTVANGRPTSRSFAWIAAALVAITAAAVCSPASAQARAALTQNVDEPGRSPFALYAGNSTLNAYFATFKVPATQRYVVDNFTVRCDIAAGYSLTKMTLQGVTGGVPSEITGQGSYSQFNGYISGVQVNSYSGTAQGPLYADPGSSITIFASDGTGGGNFKNCNFYVTGHAINNP